ncbi:hypothetical protein [Chitinivorax sp. B]|uniref:hypothetical protein n=1 Tax=Chitinivorax sp. B TaxID=2502235 RepID=UPI0010F68AEA|nr:hypothetical protein [Chitinivorax sp. B]
MKTAGLLLCLFATSALSAEPKMPRDKELSPSWGMMTPEERTTHHDKMRSFKTYDECKSYMEEHHKQMSDRAKEQNRPGPMMRRNPCDRMKTRGFFK